VGLKVATKDYIAFDTDLPGFGVRVMPSGRRFFLVQYRRHGRTRRVMLGQFGIVTAEVARREATIKLGSVRGAGGDPAALRDAERQSTTMKELGARFLNQYVPVRCKPSTQAEYRRSVELFLEPFFAKQRVRSAWPGRGFDRNLQQLGSRGWRRSADRTSLQANSLVSGNFTGNFAILGLRDTILCQETAALQPLLEQFPTQIISENILENSEFSNGIRE
jgi:hypothetical protein